MNKSFSSVRRAVALVSSLVLAGFLASCGVPWPTFSADNGAGNVTVDTNAATLKSDEARLVFSTQNRAVARAAEGATFMTVQLEAATDGTVKFASATKDDPNLGAYTMTVSGLVGGLWKLKVRLYDTEADKNLLWYANLDTQIVPGKNNAITVELYAVGTLNGVTLENALMPDHVTLKDEKGSSAPTVAVPVGIGTKWSLFGVAYGSTDDATPASNPQVTWSSSNPSIAEVAPNGDVNVRGPGLATITATSVVDPSKSAVYKLEGVNAIVGTWHMSSQNWTEYSSATDEEFVTRWTNQVITITKADFTKYEWQQDGDVYSTWGVYDYTDGILTLTEQKRLDVNGLTPTWTPLSTTALHTERFFADATKTTLVLSSFEGQNQASVTTVPTARGSYYEMMFRRDDAIMAKTPTLPVDNPDPNVIDFSLPLGYHPFDLAVSGFEQTPVVWTVSDPSMFGLGDVGAEALISSSVQRVAKSVGTTTMKAWALGGDFSSPLATYKVELVADHGPVFTLDGKAPGTPIYLDWNAGPFALNLAVNDTDGTSLGLVSVSSPFLSYNSYFGYYEASTYTRSSSLNSWTLYSDPSRQLAPNIYTVQVSTSDRYYYGTNASFNVYLDGAPPTASATIPSVVSGTGSTSFSLTLSDDVSGVDHDTIVVTSTLGTVSGSFDGYTYYGSLDTSGETMGSTNNTITVNASDLSGKAMTPVTYTFDFQMGPPYTVTFDANGADGGSMPGMTVPYPYAATLTANAFTRTGASFERWDTAADGSGTPYTESEALTLTGDLYLYAMWLLP